MSRVFCIEYATAVLKSAYAGNPVDRDDLMDIRLQCYINGNFSVELARRLSIGLDELSMLLGDSFQDIVMN